MGTRPTNRHAGAHLVAVKGARFGSNNGRNGAWNEFLESKFEN
jgi:hypothetical protein